MRSINTSRFDEYYGHIHLLHNVFSKSRLFFPNNLLLIFVPMSFRWFQKTIHWCLNAIKNKAYNFLVMACRLKNVPARSIFYWQPFFVDDVVWHSSLFLLVDVSVLYRIQFSNPYAMSNLNFRLIAHYSRNTHVRQSIIFKIDKRLSWWYLTFRHLDG